MKLTPSNILSIASILINVGVTIYVVQTLRLMRANGGPPPEIEVRTVNARDPFLDTVTVVRETVFGGDQVSATFVSSIRGKGYIVQSNNTFYMLYSPHLQQLATGTKVSAWFSWVNVTSTQSEGKLQLISPIELVSANLTTTLP